MAQTPDNPDAGRPVLARALARARAEGLWVLAFAAPLISVEVWALAAGAGPAREAWRLAPADVLIALLAAAGLVEIVLYRRPWASALPPAAAFVLVLAAAVSAFAAPAGVAAGGAAVEILQLIEIAIIGYAWVRWSPDRRRDVERALVAFAAIVTLNVLFAIGQLAAGAHAFHVRGLFAHRNAFGCFMAVALPVLAAAGSVPGRRPWMQMWFLIVSAAGLATMTSGGLFVAAAAGVIVAGSALGTRPGAAALAAVAVIGLLVQPQHERLRDAQFESVAPYHEVARDDWSASMRTRRWQAALNCVRDHPTFGVGPGQFRDRIKTYYYPPYGRPTGRNDDVDAYDVRFDEPGSHSLYVVTAVETGLAGLLALVFFLAWALAVSVRAVRSDATDAWSPTSGLMASGLGAGALGAVAAAAVACVFSSVMVRGVALPFVMILALAGRACDLAPGSDRVRPTGGRRDDNDGPAA